MQYAEHLGFFATHDIGQTHLLDHPRHDMHLHPTQAAYAMQRLAETGDIHRRAAIGRLAPTLCAADHAASDYRQPGLGIKPIAAGAIERQFKAVSA